MAEDRDTPTESLLDLPLWSDTTAAVEPEIDPLRPRPALEAVAAATATTGAPAAPRPAPLGARLRAGLIDLAAHAGTLAVLALGSRILGARLQGQLWGLAVTLLAFSFLYTVPALLLWGRTPGAAAAGLTVQDAEGNSPTAAQSLRRWLAQWVTWLLAGLPALVRLADRWSGTRTVDR